LPAGQWSDVIVDGVGVVRYISLHFLKSSQAPAIGWRGHRYSSTRDYLVRPAAVMREEARRSLRLKRLLHRGLDVEIAELELSAAELTTWTMRHVAPSPKLEVELDRGVFGSLQSALELMENRERSLFESVLTWTVPA
jgi:hypothetical protein